MPSNHKISVFIVTLNEAEYIRETLNSVKSLDEVIVVDSGSTDDTVAIAKELGAKVYHQAWLGYAKQKDFALKLCQNQWCFNLDGDEVVPEEVLDEIITLVNSDKHVALRVNFEDLFMGGIMHKHSHKRSIPRVFKKDKAAFPLDKLVHENVTVDGDIFRTKGRVLHYGYKDLTTFINKLNQYTSLGAQEKFNLNKKPSILKFICVFPVIFIKCYILRRMFLSGYRGFIHSTLEATFTLIKEAKLFELHIKKYLKK